MSGLAANLVILALNGTKLGLLKSVLAWLGEPECTEM